MAADQRVRRSTSPGSRIDTSPKSSEEERAARDHAKRQESAVQYVARIRIGTSLISSARGGEGQRDERARGRTLGGEDRQDRAAVAKRARGATTKLSADRERQLQHRSGGRLKALGVGKEIAGGMGSTSRSGPASRAQCSSNAWRSDRQRGQPGSGRRRSEREGQRATGSSARSIGNKYAFDPTKMLAGYAQFQAKTGDTDTATRGSIASRSSRRR